MDFQLLLKAAQANNWAEVRSLEYNAWANEAGFQPTDQQLEAFFESLLLRNRNAAMNAAGVVRAIQRVRGTRGLAARRYSNNALRYQIALHAADPNCINQGHYGFCGPTAILYDYAKHWPDRYAGCVLDLHNKRVGELIGPNGETVMLYADPNYDIAYMTAMGQAGVDAAATGPADFVILHAIRRAAEQPVLRKSSFDITRPHDVATATHSAAMKNFLLSLGYRGVVDRTFWAGQGWFPKKGAELAQHIGTCAALTRRESGPLVIMLTHPWLSVTAMDGSDWNDFDYDGGAPKKRPEPKQLADLHWICVNSLSIEGHSVTMDFMTYGSSCSHRYEFDRFAHCYYGYITAEP